MSELTKNQLKQDNTNSFPNNNTGYITPAILRDFNNNMIDSLVDEVTYTQDSASFSDRINDLDPSGSLATFTALEAATASLNAYTASQNSFNNSATASIVALQAFSSSLDATFATDVQLTSLSSSVAVTTLGLSSSVAQLQQFSSSLDSTYATDAQLTSLSSSIATTDLNQSASIAALQQFSSSLDATFATDAQLSASVSALSSSVAVTDLAQSASIAALQQFSSSLDSTFATDAQLSALSSSIAVTDLAQSSSIAALQSFSSSLDATFATDAQLTALSSSVAITTNGLDLEVNQKLDSSSFNSYTQSNDTKWNNLGNQSGSFITESETGSMSVASASFATTASFALNVTPTNVSPFLSASVFNAYTQSNDSKVNSLISATGSYVTEAESGSFVTSVLAGGTPKEISVTKGNGSVNTITVNNVDSASFATTASFALNVTPTNVSMFLSKSLFDTYTGSAALGVSQSINAATQSLSSSFAVTTNALDLEVNQKLDSSSFNSYTASNDSKVNSLIAATSSYAISSSVAAIDAGQDSKINSLISKTGSYATTGSNTFNGSQNIIGAITASSISATSASFQYVQTIFETASIIYSSGSNQLGDELSDVQTLSGSVRVQGNLTVNGVPVQTSSFDASGYLLTSSFNSYTASASTAVSGAINSATQSLSSSIAVTTNNLDLEVNQKLDSASFNSYTQSNDSKVNSLIAATGSYAISSSVATITGNSLVTASISGDTITFTKGNGTTFPIVVPTGSGVPAGTVSSSAQIAEFGYATTGSNTFNGQQTIQNILELQQPGNQLIYTSIVQDALDSKLRIAQFGGTGFVLNGGDVDVSGFNITASNFIGTASYSNEAISASFAQTASFALNAVINTGSFATTGSNEFIGNQRITGSVRVDGDLILDDNGGTTQFLINEKFTTEFLGSNLRWQEAAKKVTWEAFESEVQLALAAYSASYDNGFIVDVKSDGTTLSDYNTSFVNQPWLKVPVNGNNNPPVQFPRGAGITGSLSVSGSSTFDGQSVFNGVSVFNTPLTASGARINGNIVVTGDITASNLSINGVSPILVGQTASFASASISASFAQTASFLLGSVASASFATSASFAVTSSLSQNVVIIARNGNASTLSAGTIVHITGASGDNPIFNTASFDTELLSANTLGVLRQSAASGADVDVLVNGIVYGVNTDPALGYVAGDIIYLSSSGQFTRVQPQAPQQIVTIGQVLRAQQNNGSIYVNISNGWELNELHNVAINGEVDGDLLVYRSASGLWTNSSSLELGNATTGSNTFVGNQIVSASVYVRNGDIFNIGVGTTLNPDLYLSESVVGQANIIKGWGDNPTTAGPGASQANYTGSLRITGSNNTVSLPQIRGSAVGGGADQQGYISGSDNVIAGNLAGIFLNTGSQLFPKTATNYVSNNSAILMNFTTSSLGTPTVNNNILNSSNFVINHPSGSVLAANTNFLLAANISSSQGFVTNIRPNINQNIVFGNAHTLRHISSSTNYTANMGNAPVIVENHMSSSGISNNALNFYNNLLWGGSSGATHNIYVSGSQSSNATRNIIDNIIGGRNIIVSSSFVSSSNSSLVASLIYGQNLIVSGNHGTSAGGSTFVGRNNDTGSGLANAQDIVFAVGTGTSTSARRTGLWIDSGSLTTINGGLYVSQSQLTLTNSGSTPNSLALAVRSGSVEVTSPQGNGYFYTNLPITSSNLRINGDGIIADLYVSGVFSGNSTLNVAGNSYFTGSVNVNNNVNITGSLDVNGTNIINTLNGLSSQTSSYARTNTANTFTADQTITGSVRVDGDLIVDDDGGTTSFLINQRFSTEFLGSQMRWQEANKKFTWDAYESIVDINLSAYSSSYDNGLSINLRADGTTFSDYDTSFVTQSWLRIPVNNNNNPAPQFPRGAGITGSLLASGSTTITGSVVGNVNALSISSNTASLNLNNGNFFTLQLVSGSSTHIAPTNIKPGQTISLRLNTTGSGTVTFDSSIKQASGSAYVPTTTTGVDVLTLISFDTQSLYISNLKNFN